MNVHLLFADRDFDREGEAPWNARALVDDLGLTAVFAAMSNDDALLAGIAQRVMLASVSDEPTIAYRQAILEDCIAHEAVVRAIYALANDAIEAERKAFWLGALARRASSVLYRADELLHALVQRLRRLRAIADEHAGTFASHGFTALFGMLRSELSDEYFEIVDEHLRALKFERGVLVSSALGEGNKGTDYVLRRGEMPGRGWLQRVLGASQAGVYSVELAPQDESGARALGELRDTAINVVANAAAQSADHVLGFFAALRWELGFYVGCLNLHERLEGLGTSRCFPEPAPTAQRARTAAGLYDVSLALNAQRTVVENDLHGDGAMALVITGANHGGKSTFLRAIGIAQLMMQCGMFVPAQRMRASLCDGIFTHYKREEDPTMTSGKLDEELTRMRGIVDRVSWGSLVLFNESFAATNEREGSEIARQIVTALAESGVTAVFVTHLYEFASAMRHANVRTLFLRAERLEDGSRTFKMIEGEPLETSYGRDLYARIF